MRREFSTKTMLAAFQRANGHCEGEGCGARLTVGKFRYDHIIPCELGGDASLGNCQCLCWACDRAKTGGQDIPQIAKAKRQEIAFRGAKARSKRPMPGSRNSPWKKTVSRGWVRRDTGEPR